MFQINVDMDPKLKRDMISLLGANFIEVTAEDAVDDDCKEWFETRAPKETRFFLGQTAVTASFIDNFLLIIKDILNDQQGEDETDEESLDRATRMIGEEPGTSSYERAKNEIIWMWSIYSRRQADGIFLERSDYPADQLSWFDCAIMLNLLSRMTEGCEPFYDIEIERKFDESEDAWILAISGHVHKDESDVVESTFALPFKGLWETAAIGGVADAEHYGVPKGWSKEDIGWFDENSGGTLQPVGLKYPNDFGFYDLLGNTWEWLSDQYEEDED